MPVTPPRCKFCDHLHWERICPYIGKPKVRVIKVPEPKATKPLALPAPAKKRKAKQK